MVSVRLTAVAVLFVLVMCSNASAQLPMIREAEQCTIKCGAGDKCAENIWAREKHTTPDFWGRAVGDSITWPATFMYPHEGLKLGVRYSFNELSYKAGFPVNPKRMLHVSVDDGKPIALHVPDTGSWGVFEMSVANLPPIKAGTHEIKVTASEPNNTANVDTLVLFEGKLESLPVTLRKTTVATSKHFVIHMTPAAAPSITSDEIPKEFERIYTIYSASMGFTPPEPVAINVIEDDKWPRSGAGAFMNAAGIHYLASIMHQEQGNWLHEMTHMFYYGRFPNWFEEPSVRVMTIAVWIHTVFPSPEPLSKDAKYQRYMLQGHDVLDNPGKKFDTLEPILVALIVKYGESVYSRFYNLCAKAGKKGEINFVLERPISKEQLIKYMSEAAGEDVRPLFRRWKGFETAAP